MPTSTKFSDVQTEGSVQFHEDTLVYSVLAKWFNKQAGLHTVAGSLDPSPALCLPQPHCSPPLSPSRSHGRGSGALYSQGQMFLTIRIKESQVRCKKDKAPHEQEFKDK